ncbi:MAG: hypothetical protein JNK93_17525 [Planctomycetia bacterium]|nr:hypothetical protein [Planctomycetia bacterium]
MKTKTAILSTLGVVVLAIVLGIGSLFLFINPNARNANERAAKVGQGVAFVAMLPIAGIWIAWGLRKRAEREEMEQERQDRKKRKRSTKE